MRNELWFVTNGISLIYVHPKENEAEKEYNKYLNDPDFEYFDYYCIDIDDLEDYPDEYDLALEEGYIE